MVHFYSGYIYNLHNSLILIHSPTPHTHISSVSKTYHIGVEDMVTKSSVSYEVYKKKDVIEFIKRGIDFFVNEDISDILFLLR